MSGYSHTGTWVVHSGDRLVGPFDGRTPAMAFVRTLRLEGYDGRAERLWRPDQVHEAIEVRKGETPG